LVEKPYNKTSSRLRLAALYALVAVLLWLARPTPLSVTLGFLPLVLGEMIRFWAAGYLRKTAELVTSGPYRFTRNPLYLGRLLIFTGLCIMARLPHGGNLAVLVAGWAVFFGYYLRRKERVEPARLREVHGEAYERYFRAVPKLFPTLRPYPDPNRIGWSSERMLRNREQWMVVGLALITLFLLWRAYDPALREADAESSVREQVGHVLADSGADQRLAVPQHGPRVEQASFLHDHEDALGA
jgi:protein-S-isoprenylcysteine O-methyltransferase Ste14